MHGDHAHGDGGGKNERRREQQRALVVGVELSRAPYPPAEAGPGAGGCRALGFSDGGLSGAAGGRDVRGDCGIGAGADCVGKIRRGLQWVRRACAGLEQELVFRLAGRGARFLARVQSALQQNRTRRNVVEFGKRRRIDRSCAGPTVAVPVGSPETRRSFRLVAWKAADQSVKNVLHGLQERLGPAFGSRPFQPERVDLFGDVGAGFRRLAGSLGFLKFLQEVSGRALERPRLPETTGHGVEPPVERCELVVHGLEGRLTGEMAFEAPCDTFDKSICRFPIEGRGRGGLDAGANGLQLLLDGLERARFSLPIGGWDAIEPFGDLRQKRFDLGTRAIPDLGRLEFVVQVADQRRERLDARGLEFGAEGVERGLDPIGGGLGLPQARLNALRREIELIEIGTSRRQFSCVAVQPRGNFRKALVDRRHNRGRRRIAGRRLQRRKRGARRQTFDLFDEPGDLVFEPLDRDAAPSGGKEKVMHLLHLLANRFDDLRANHRARQLVDPGDERVDAPLDVGRGELRVMEAEGVAQLVGDPVKRRQQEFIAFFEVERGNALRQGAKGLFERRDHLTRRQSR